MVAPTWCGHGVDLEFIKLHFGCAGMVNFFLSRRAQNIDFCIDDVRVWESCRQNPVANCSVG